MKILFYTFKPFCLTHGGLQTQVLQTREALQALGVETDFLHWWDPEQSGDILHFFGRMPPPLLIMAQQKGMKVVLTDLLTEQGSRARWRLTLQKLTRRAMALALPEMFTAAFNWDAYRLADACVALTSWEAQLMTDFFDARADSTHVVPNGVEEVFLDSRAAQRGPWLVCTATVTERKRVLELAQAAVQAETPLWIIGKPYSQADPYFRRLRQMAQAHASIIRYEGSIGDRAKLAEVYRSARGFVLLSAMESLSLSALEAAACGCPLLLSDLPWARTVFGQSASYCPVANSTQTAEALRQFYAAAPGLPPSPRPLTWLEVGQQLKRLYEALLSGPSSSFGSNPTVVATLIS
jgi:glycosyltransferase involved in cell wall biosynthesis